MFRNTILFALAALLASASLAAEPLPADIQPAFDERLSRLAPARDGARHCWAHRLAGRASRGLDDRQAARLEFCVGVERIVPEEPPLVVGEIARYRYNFRLRAWLGGRKRPAVMIGECGWAYAPEDVERASGRYIRCAVDCDGGGLDVMPFTSGGLMLARIEPSMLPRGCGSTFSTADAGALTGNASLVLLLTRAAAFSIPGRPDGTPWDTGERNG